MAPTGNCGKHVKNLQSDGTWLNMGAHPGISSAKKSAPARKTRIFCRKYPLRSPYRSGPRTEHAKPERAIKSHACFAESVGCLDPRAGLRYA